MIELSLPAGSLTEALVAFSSGADSVYFGMKKFSARKGAENFSVEDLSKIKRYSVRNGKKIYVALNTLVNDFEMPEVFETLKTLESYEVDAVIVRDPGIAKTVTQYFPSLTLHGSTQSAVHSACGVKAMEKAGYRRVVLSRELTLDEIRGIRASCPGVELKVFIQGAMCYGFSGLCMASKILTGRSANRGECSQICRKSFIDENGKIVHPFSLEDLRAGEIVKELEEIGIDALKVEGRMKGPKYVKAAAQYYRAIIDGKSTDDSSHALNVSFQRKCGKGYFRSVEGMKTTGDETSHIGEYIGRVVSSDGRCLTVNSKIPIKNHDGILLISDGFRYGFSAKVSDKIVIMPESVDVPNNASVYMLSDSSLNAKIPSSDIPPWSRRIKATVELFKSSISVKTRFLEKTYQIDTEVSSEPQSDSILKIFGSSGLSYTLIPEVPATVYHARPSDLKSIRNRYLEELIPLIRDTRKYKVSVRCVESVILPDRNLISPSSLCNIEGTVINGIAYFSLPPVRFNEDEIYSHLLSNASKYEKALIGMNNIGDIVFASNHPEFDYFFDVFMFVSNRDACSNLLSMVPTLRGGYLNPELREYEEPWPLKPTMTDYVPPLFISRCAEPAEGIYRINDTGMEVRVEDSLRIVDIV